MIVLFTNDSPRQFMEIRGEEVEPGGDESSQKNDRAVKKDRLVYAERMFGRLVNSKSKSNFGQG